MARDFFPFVEEQHDQQNDELLPRHATRIAIYDSSSAAPRVLVVDPKDVRSYLEEITATVNKYVREQRGDIPFMVIREIVENFIHAYFRSPTISILDNGNTIRFTDQGPGIKEKNLALEYGTSSATEEMRHYIRGVGSGLPYVQQYMNDKGGSLEIEDNILGGTVITISTRPLNDARTISKSIHKQDMSPYREESTAQQVLQQTYNVPQNPIQNQVPYTDQTFVTTTQVVPQSTITSPAFVSPTLTSPVNAAQSLGTPQTFDISQTPSVSQTAYSTSHATPFNGNTGFSSSTSANPFTHTTFNIGNSQLDISERGKLILSYLSEQASVGPTDLTQSFGSSSPTWSRELTNLSMLGIITKEGQKYRLTALGKLYIQN